VPHNLRLRPASVRPSPACHRRDLADPDRGGHLRRDARPAPIGEVDSQTPDIPSLQALALWTALLIIVLCLIGDVVIALLDPVVRTGERSPR